jgi:lipopolysaccharide biosynthesis protein
MPMSSDFDTLAPKFSESDYWDRYPGARLLGMEFTEHFRKYGRRLGYLLVPSHNSTALAFDGIDTQGELRDTCVILAMFSPSTKLTDQQIKIIKFYQDAGIYPFVVINCTCPLQFTFPADLSGASWFIRENIGFDFGAWKEAFGKISVLQVFDHIILANDSIIPVGEPEILRVLINRAQNLNYDIVFATISHEIRPHGQSFFFVLMAPAAKSFMTDYLLSLKSHSDKIALIQEVETTMLATMIDADLSVSAAFRVEEAEQTAVNPTILYWETLLEQGFPFIKAQLFSSGLLSYEDERVRRWLSDYQIVILEDHLAGRNSGEGPQSQLWDQSFRTFKGDGSGRSAFTRDLTWLTPVHFDPLPVERSHFLTEKPEFTVCVQVHMYFSDVFEEITSYISNILGEFDLFVTTDTETKKAVITRLLKPLSFVKKVEVIICPNHGRDVKPFLTQLSGVFDRYDIIAHLHTKKAETVEWGDLWRTNILENLIGTSDRVNSILSSFHSDQGLGLIIPQPYLKIAPLVEWAGLKDSTEAVLAIIGTPVTLPESVMFPAGNMFWARTVAIRQTLGYDWTNVDFDLENGQVGETIMHAIERHWAYLAAFNGFRTAYIGQKG